MNDQELRRELKELHDQIEGALKKEPLDKDMLGHVMTDLVKVSQGLALQPHEEETLKEQLEHQASDFEMRHPRLASTFREIMDILAKLGI